MMRKLIVFVLMLFVAMPIVAQVEFQVDKDPAPEFSGLSEENKIVVEFMYLTQKDEFCTMFAVGRNAELSVCVFEDLLTGEQHLYLVYGGYDASFFLFYESRAVGQIPNESGVSNLAPGDYELAIFYDSGLPRLVDARVSFTVVGSDIAESVRLETPEIGTLDTWYQVKKQEMASGCNVGYVWRDSGSAGDVVISPVMFGLVGENTIREVTSHSLYSLYGDSWSALVPFMEGEDVPGEDELRKVYMYAAPTHQQEYKLRYEREGLLYEVFFEYESGITTGTRNVYGAIGIEC